MVSHYTAREVTMFVSSLVPKKVDRETYSIFVCPHSSCDYKIECIFDEHTNKYSIDVCSTTDTHHHGTCQHSQSILESNHNTIPQRFQNYDTRLRPISTPLLLRDHYVSTANTGDRDHDHDSSQSSAHDQHFQNPFFSVPQLAYLKNWCKRSNWNPKMCQLPTVDTICELKSEIGQCPNLSRWFRTQVVRACVKKRVAIMAWHFDDPKSKLRWSKKVYGSDWHVSKCYGDVIGVEIGKGFVAKMWPVRHTLTWTSLLPPDMITWIDDSDDDHVASSTCWLLQHGFILLGSRGGVQFSTWMFCNNKIKENHLRNKLCSFWEYLINFRFVKNIYFYHDRHYMPYCFIKILFHSAFRVTACSLPQLVRAKCMTSVHENYNQLILTTPTPHTKVYKGACWHQGITICAVASHLYASRCHWVCMTHTL